MHVLLIDDDNLLRETVRTFLERAGHSVEDTDDGSVGIEYLRAHHVDVVITDIIMPGRQEGMEVIGQVVEEFSGIPIIAISGGSENGAGSYLETAAALGCFRTLKKPFDRRILLETVDAAVQARDAGELERGWQ